MLYPPLHHEIARQRQRSSLAGAERYRISEEARVEYLQEQLHVLVERRQALRAREANRDELESNWLELVRRQQELSRALIAACLGRFDRKAA